MAKTRRKTGNGSSQKRAMRPTWEGHLRLSLVTCPVALYTATARTSDGWTASMSSQSRNTSVISSA